MAILDCVNILCTKLQFLLAKQTAFKHLPENGCLVLASLCFFCMVSWGTYCLLAPHLLRRSTRQITEQAAAIARVKWGHQLCGFFHALLSSLASAYLLYTCVWSDSLETRVSGHQPGIGKAFSFSMGYFLWDICSCLYFIDVYGISYFLHGITTLIVCLVVVKPAFQRHALYFLPYEVSSIFLNLHWMMAQTGYKKTKWLWLVDASGCLSYFVFRVIGGPYCSYLLLNDIIESRSSLSNLMIWISAAAILSNNTLNYYWFYKLVRTLVRKFRAASTAPSAQTPVGILFKKDR